ELAVPRRQSDAGSRTTEDRHRPSSILPSALEAFPCQIVEIVLPIAVAIAAELEQIVPAENPGGVQVVEHQPDRVIADRMHIENGDLLLARNGLAPIGGMTLHLGAGALDAQIFGAELETFPVVERNGQRLAVLVQPQLRRPGLRLAAAHGMPQV